MPSNDIHDMLCFFILLGDVEITRIVFQNIWRDLCGH